MRSVRRFANIVRVVSFVVVVSGSVASAQAQAQYVNEVRGQLQLLEAVFEENGYASTHSYKIDKLNQNREEVFSLRLRQGHEYLLASVCDTDCSDIDIKVYDENGNQIAQDTQVDDMPVVRVRPRWSGPFRIRVKMYSCTDNPCYYGIGVFGK